MYTLTDKAQLQALSIKNGKYKLTDVQSEFVDWITRRFGVVTLDFSCEIRTSSKGVRQQLVHIILETAEHVKQMQMARTQHVAIAERFLDYLKSAETHGNIDPVKCDVLKVADNPFPEVVVTFRPLKNLGDNIVSEIRDDEVFAILETFESVWTKSQSVIFFYTDAQIKENDENGTSAKIVEKLNDVHRKYGLENDLTYRFDSKETFDRDYGSNWHYYWQ